MPIWLIALSAGASLYVPLLGLAWGWRLVVDHRLPRPRLRFLAAPVAWLLLAMALGGTALSGPFQLPEGAGGAVGAVTLGHLIENLAPIGFAAGLTFSVTAGLATLLGLWALALDIAELSLLGQLLRRAAGFSVRYARIGLASGLSRVPRPSLPRMPSLFSRKAVALAPVRVQHAGTSWAGPTRLHRTNGATRTVVRAAVIPRTTAVDGTGCCRSYPLPPQLLQRLMSVRTPEHPLEAAGRRHRRHLCRWAMSRNCRRSTCCRNRVQRSATQSMPTC